MKAYDYVRLLSRRIAPLPLEVVKLERARSGASRSCEICPSLGIQFGCKNDPVTRDHVHRRWRAE
jgi:hypothetical protein